MTDTLRDQPTMQGDTVRDDTMRNQADVVVPIRTPEPRRRTSARAIATIVALVMALGIAIAVAISGNVASGNAERDVNAAKAIVPQRETARQAAERDLGQADRRLTDVRDSANSVAKKARATTPTASEIVDLDKQRLELRKRQHEAIGRGDFAEFNRLVDLLNSTGDRKNALLRQLRAVLPA